MEWSLEQGRRQLFVNGASIFFRGGGAPLLHLYRLILQHSGLAADSFPFDIITYRKAKATITYTTDSMYLVIGNPVKRSVAAEEDWSY